MNYSSRSGAKPPYIIRFSIKGHIFAKLFHSRVGHHFGIGGIASLFRGVLNPAEHYLFTLFGFHRHAKIGLLAIRDIIRPALDHTRNAPNSLNNGAAFAAISRYASLFFRRYGNNKTINILHESDLRSEQYDRRIRPYLN